MKRIILTIIGLYQKLFSPLLHSLGLGGGCRFYPSCSQYSNQAIKKCGLLKGIIKSFKRIIRCQPFNKGGYDPC